METQISNKLATFFSSFPLQTYKKGELLLDAGTEPRGIFYIESGIVRTYAISQEGSEVTLNMYKPQSFFPMSWAIAHIANAYFYEAITDTTVRRAPKEDVLTLMKKEPDIVYDLLRRVYVGIEGLMGHIESLSSGDSSKRLITSLIILGKRFGQPTSTGVLVSLKMNEQDIASYAGISRETASRELQKLKKENVVSFQKGTMTISQIERLEKLLTQ